MGSILGSIGNMASSLLGGGSGTSGTGSGNGLTLTPGGAQSDLINTLNQENAIQEQSEELSAQESTIKAILQALGQA